MPAIVLAEHAENEVRKEFTKSERVAIAQAIETELGNRQGQRTDLVNEGQAELPAAELRPNLDEVLKGRTDEIAAKKAGFGGKTTYRQAKTVVTKGTPELVAAMDKEAIAVSTAAKLHFKTARNYAWVAAQFPLAIRMASTSFDHHRKLAIQELTKEQRYDLLEKSRKNAWSRTTLTRERDKLLGKVADIGHTEERPPHAPTGAPLADMILLSHLAHQSTV